MWATPAFAAARMAFFCSRTMSSPLSVNRKSFSAPASASGKAPRSARSTWIHVAGTDMSAFCGRRESARTCSPRSASSRTSSLPMVPVAPVTTIIELTERTAGRSCATDPRSLRGHTSDSACPAGTAEYGSKLFARKVDDLRPIGGTRNGGDALVASGSRLVGLTRADDLLVLRCQGEPEVAGFRRRTSKARVVLAVVLNGLYAVHGSGFRRVPLAGEDRLSVARLQSKSIFALLVREDLKGTRHSFYASG